MRALLFTTPAVSYYFITGTYPFDSSDGTHLISPLFGNPYLCKGQTTSFKSVLQ
jgi:hypothetical protein